MESTHIICLFQTHIQQTKTYNNILDTTHCFQYTISQLNKLTGAMNMKMIIKFDCDNAAFEDRNNEISWILKKLADKLETCHDDNEELYESIHDSNGNKIGFYQRS